MDTLSAKRAAGGISFPWDAVTALEAAGVLQALTAPVDGISNRRAAAILNDYGFLASQIGRPRRTVEAALRRAIAFDPGRSLAHLNLADFLRSGLGRYAATGGNVPVRTQEINAHYRAYVASGSKPSASVSSFLRGDPGAGAKSDCNAIAMWTNAGRLKELVSDIGTNLPWKDTRIDLVFTTQGTAHVPFLEVFDATTDRVLDEATKAELETISENLWGGSQLGLITLHGRHHIIHYLDWNHPIETTPLNGGEECSFEASVRESIGPRATEPQLCRALQAGSIDSTLEFGGEAQLSPEEIRAIWRETEIVGTRAIDFGNAGALQNVAELRMDSSAGAGCGETFYELLNADGTELLRGPQRDQLMKLQAADGEGRYPVRCGNQPRFFSHGNRIYFESKPATWPPTSDRDQYHMVATVRTDSVVDVCDFKFQSSVAARRR